ncbi:amino-acid permease BAT1 homolog isoform X2 [Papaver somniferum]|uniref:amino-acid permease BAT1 homolog isoform X2 n=1 Tax=Papaver somniferum TaxID=3469 RepID=UPI000E6FBC3F|nr:amino-acid permease BAT1 homolog isoform X2 [Papaver somniferum]
MVLEHLDPVFPSEAYLSQDGDNVRIDTGESRLAQLGYYQELDRSLSVISNFALCFVTVSVLQGITTLYSQGLQYGGPISMIYGWLIASFFTMFVGLSMAEICSSYPTSGGLYYWSAKLAGPSWAPFASWLTCWFNMVGQWANTTSVDFSLAQMVQVIILLSTGGKNGGVFLLMVLIPFVAPKRASVEYISTHFNTDTAVGIQSKPYIFVLGLLMSSYTLAGYDASVHLVEETKSADRNGPKGIISAIVVSFIVGWGYLLGITFAVTDIPHLVNPNNDAGGYAAAQLFYEAFKSRYGSGVGGIICFGVAAVAIFFCGMGTITNNSRMVYAFSRDGAMPYSSVWHKLNKNEVPINAVWLSVAISFVMALTSLLSLVAFQSMVSIATVGINISYVIPIFYRITLGNKTFTRGPFNLGRYGMVVGWIAVMWVAAMTVLFSLPVAYPITRDTFNYTPAAIGGLLILVVSWWVLDARHWFKGPITNIDTTMRTN